MTPWFQLGSHWRRVGEPGRWQHQAHEDSTPHFDSRFAGSGCCFAQLAGYLALAAFAVVQEFAEARGSDAELFARPDFARSAFAIFGDASGFSQWRLHFRRRGSRFRRRRYHFLSGSQRERPAGGFGSCADAGRRGDCGDGRWKHSTVATMMLPNEVRIALAD